MPLTEQGAVPQNNPALGRSILEHDLAASSTEAARRPVPRVLVRVTAAALDHLRFCFCSADVTCCGSSSDAGMLMHCRVASAHLCQLQPRHRCKQHWVGAPRRVARVLWAMLPRLQQVLKQGQAVD